LAFSCIISRNIIFNQFFNKTIDMGSGILRNILSLSIVMLLVSGNASAQNKDVEKGKKALEKAMEQKDLQARQKLINEAQEDYTKGKVSTQEFAVVLGDMYLDKKNWTDAANAYSRASKEDKKAGFKKVADGILETIFDGDAKAEVKAVKQVIDFYKKGDAVKEGYRNLGDKYYGKGEEGYAKAITYYNLGESAASLEKIAKEYFDKGGANEDKAAEVYVVMKNYQKAGDIYFNRKEYAKANDAYQTGNNAEGIKKYADYLYSQNRNDDADNLYVKIAAIYATAKDDNALEKLAHESQAKGSYGLAARIYDKAGNTTMSDKSNGYASLIELNLDSAKIFFTSVNEADMLKAMTDNAKQLNALKDIGDNLDVLKRGAPSVNPIVDSVTGVSSLSAKDEKDQEEYYKSIRDQVFKAVSDVSTNFGKLTNPDLKKYLRFRFIRYQAVRNILDTQTMSLKKQKADVKVKDVEL